MVDDGRVQGYLYIVLAGEEHASVFGILEASWILRLTTGLVLASLLLAGAGALLLVRRLTRPLRALAREMKAFANQELAAAQPGRDDPGDELELLTLRFRQMAERLREQLRALAANDRSRRELVAGVSHDLRTPLTHLQGYLETLLLKDDLAAGKRQEYLEIAYQECLRLARLVADLFELAKLESLQAPVEREVFSLPELAHDVAQKFRLQALKKGVELEIATGVGLGLVDADLRLLERVLENLLDNAVRYTPAGGRVVLEVAPAEGEVAIAVADTGPGIPAEEVGQVFDRFYRGRRESRAEGDGAGLGLAIARRALQLHGGDIECDSRPGAGTIFRFALPAADGTASTASPPPRRSLPARDA
jgi:two-component system, OmpR family, sensor kinase